MTSTTSLGMPPSPPPTTAPTWKSAWDAALYGPDGFFRREAPSAHFRTSVHASPLFAAAIVELVHRSGLDTVVDIGAGRGELLTQIHEIDPSLSLLAVEGLVIANEWLDNIPCHVVEVDDDGVIRVVHVDPHTGNESLGSAVTSSSVPRSLAEWCASWWALDPGEPGVRAEVGTSRDAAWADVVRRVHHGLAIAVDYGHTAEDRPAFGSLRSYLSGDEVDVLPDGSRDVTAHVAVDAVAAGVSGKLIRQRDALGLLGVSGSRPDLELATTDPSGYVGQLSRATEAAELTAANGLGGFYWIVSATSGLDSPLS